MNPRIRPVSINDASKFAHHLVKWLLSWSTSGVTIETNVFIGRKTPLAVVILTLGKPTRTTQAINESQVASAVKRAIEIAPTCEPIKGDLCVFDGKRILLFRRFDESFSPTAAKASARELAGHILMNRKPSESINPCPLSPTALVTEEA